MRCHAHIAIDKAGRSVWRTRDGRHTVAKFLSLKVKCFMINLNSQREVTL